MSESINRATALARVAAASAAGVGFPLGAPTSATADDDAALLVNLAPTNGVVSAERAAASGIPTRELMRKLLTWARSFANPPISHHFVGAVAEGTSGALYAGMNLEFPGQTLAHTVHAEGAATNNAWLHEETGIASLAVTSVPCGYCRHFLREFVAPDKLVIAMPDRTATLAEALPFYPPLTATDPFHVRAALELSKPSADELTNVALAAACRSYGPYSGTRAGVAVSLPDGTVFGGRYAENSAFNPVMPALQSALIGLRLAGYKAEDITRAVLTEVPGKASQRGASTSVLATFSPITLGYAVATERT